MHSDCLALLLPSSSLLRKSISMMADVMAGSPAAPARAAARLALGAALGGVALDARRRAARVDAGSGEAVADFYMHLWKCFFACYALLPFVR